MYVKAKKELIPIGEYNTYRNKLTTLIRKSKKQYYYRVFSNFKNNLKKIWTEINSLMNKNNKISKTNPIKIKGKLTNNHQVIANEFNNFFGSIGKSLDDSLPPSTVDPMSFLSGNFPSSMGLIPSNDQDIQNIIKMLANKKCSINDISVESIKDNSDLFAPAIKILYNQSIETGIFPDIFKHSIIVPIYKNGLKSEINNYRPISLLNIFGKIFEKLMKKNLVNFCKKYKIISPNQYGFQDGVSTFDALSNFSDFLYKNLDEGKKILAIFIDFNP